MCSSQLASRPCVVLVACAPRMSLERRHSIRPSFTYITSFCTGLNTFRVSRNKHAFVPVCHRKDSRTHFHSAVFRKLYLRVSPSNSETRNANKIDSLQSHLQSHSLFCASLLLFLHRKTTSGNVSNFENIHVAKAIFPNIVCMCVVRAANTQLSLACHGPLAAPISRKFFATRAAMVNSGIVTQVCG